MSLQFSCASALLLTAGLILPASAAPPAGRLSEPAGGFSYVPPAGWQVRTFPGMKYHLSVARPASGFAPNINVVDETAAVPLDRYMQLSLGPMKQAYHNLRVSSQSPFATNSGLRGFRMAITGVITGRNLRQIFYIFPAPDSRKVVVTASWLAADGDKYAAAADKAMKTFKLL